MKMSTFRKCYLLLCDFMWKLVSFSSRSKCSSCEPCPAPFLWCLALVPCQEIGAFWTDLPLASSFFTHAFYLFIFWPYFLVTCLAFSLSLYLNVYVGKFSLHNTVVTNISKILAVYHNSSLVLANVTCWLWLCATCLAPLGTQDEDTTSFLGPAVFMAVWEE